MLGGFVDLIFWMMDLFLISFYATVSAYLFKLNLTCVCFSNYVSGRTLTWDDDDDPGVGQELTTFRRRCMDLLVCISGLAASAFLERHVLLSQVMRFALGLPLGCAFVRHVIPMFAYTRAYMAISRRRKWQPTPVFLPGETCGQRSLVGCCPWARTELDTTEAT